MLMAHVITPPRDAIQHPLLNFTHKHTVRLRYGAIYSFGCFIFNFTKASSAVNYLSCYMCKQMTVLLKPCSFVHHTAVCVSCREIQRKVLHDGNSLIKVCTCLYTSIMQLKLEYSTCLNSICVYFDLCRIKVIKNLCLNDRVLIRVLS